nr:MAG TPA_asm: hypothetical protein [Caudoviricetes sp.]DAM14770.1 MAG TPA: hypothetical protein [Caudoviricetes sp.]
MSATLLVLSSDIVSLGLIKSSSVSSSSTNPS